MASHGICFGFYARRLGIFRAFLGHFRVVLATCCFSSFQAIKYGEWFMLLFMLFTLFRIPLHYHGLYQVHLWNTDTAYWQF
ncbi:hypothetical protein FPQ18DRAFT_64705 [Pyronema domesticum]|nr:hypothetical protein FPQ18DRAFT_64705 [Pyronema domesticum]